MENTVLEERSDSLTLPSGRNLESLQKRTPQRSEDAEDEGDGNKAEQKQELYDLLLTQLQSLIGEIREAGVEVRLFRNADKTFIELPGVNICPKHLMMHGGPTCPHC
jgi:hypothetical protein